MDISLHPFRLPLRGPIAVGGIEISERRGIIVKICGEEGSFGLGEVAPLPGLDRDGLDALHAELGRLTAWLPGRGFPGEPKLDAPFFGLPAPPFKLSPLAAFGMEGALLWLMAARGRIRLSPERAGEALAVAVNGLFSPPESDREAGEQLTQLKDSGFSTVKVKIGRLDPELEIRRIKDLWDFFGGNVRLRLDANRALSPSLYRGYYEALEPMNVEYVEEPLGKDFPVSSAPAVPWPLALDESAGLYLNPDNPDPGDLPAGVAAVILKPGSFWGVSGMFKAMKALGAAGVKTVLSSSFNTGAGIIALALLARLAARDTAHGLDTLKRLDGDVLAESPAIKGGRMVLPGSVFSAGLRQDFGAACGVSA